MDLNMNKKIWLAVFFIIVVVTAFLYNYYLDLSSNELAIKNAVIEGQGGIYCMNTSRDVFFISGKDYSIINKTKVVGGWDMAAVRDDKIYITIRGNLSNGGKEIAILRGGVIDGNIELEYPLPRFVRYNEYNEKAYVGHIFIQGKNYITVIDTKNDLVEKYFPYDYNIEDIAFSEDNIMMVSSSTAHGVHKIDIINLDNYSILKSIPIDFRTSSINVVGNTIYATNAVSDKSLLYAVDWNKESQTIEKIKLKDTNPYKIYKKDINGKPYLYVTHYNIDDMSGKSITIVDPEKKEAIKRIENVQSSRDITFNNGDILAGDRVNERILVINNDEIIKEIIKLGRPISIASTRK